jgi:hypothetical protein
VKKVLAVRRRQSPAREDWRQLLARCAEHREVGGGVEVVNFSREQKYRIITIYKCLDICFAQR